MKVQVRTTEDISIVDCWGEVDLNTSGELRETLQNEMRSQTPGVLVNLSGVTYMDSSGVASLVEALQTSGATRTRFALYGLQPPIQSVLEMARLDRIFVIFANEEEAVEKIWNVQPFGGV
jgi:anti-sigma B factor antagonist